MHRTLWLTTRITRVKVSALRWIPCSDRPSTYVTRGRRRGRGRGRGKASLSERLQSRKLACGFEKLRRLRRKKCVLEGLPPLRTVNSKWDFIVWREGMVHRWRKGMARSPIPIILKYHIIPLSDLSPNVKQPPVELPSAPQARRKWPREGPRRS